MHAGGGWHERGGGAAGQRIVACAEAGPDRDGTGVAGPGAIALCGGSGRGARGSMMIWCWQAKGSERTVGERSDGRLV